MPHRILLMGTPQHQKAWPVKACSQAGHKVFGAPGVAEALPQVRSVAPTALVLLGNLGTDATRAQLHKLKMSPATRMLPLLAMTQATGMADVVAAIRAGAAEVLLFAMPASMLMERFERALGNGPDSARARDAVERRGPAVFRRLGDHLVRFQATGRLRALAPAR